MLRAKLTRCHFGTKCTLGVFELDGDTLLFQCYTCEDAVLGDGNPATVAEWKIKGRSAIPYGTYPLRLTYSPKYGRKVWEICDVPGFKGIRIHSGNTAEDTEGCLLLGEHINGDCSGVAKSKITIKRFEAIMMQYAINADTTIEITKEEI